MNRIFHGEIGGCAKLPMKTHSFTLDRAVDFMTVDMKTENKVWMQILLWYNDRLLKLQHVHVNEESLVVLHKNPQVNCISGVPGQLMAGDYKLQVFSTSLSEEYYTIEIKYDEATEFQQDAEYEIWCDGNDGDAPMHLNLYDFSAEKAQGLRWYKGDFHTHTILSDGKMNQKQLLEVAEKRGLDFYVATDHNILPAKSVKSNILVIPGMEVTSDSSHFNAIGLKNWLDLRIDKEDFGLASGKGMNRLLIEAAADGAIRSINHPELSPWKWVYEDTLLENIDTLEIINDPTYMKNMKATEEALKIWNLLWNDGYRIWGIGGSDAHMFPTETYKGSDKPSIIGDPSTYVLSNGLSSDGIISGVKNGKVYVSRDIEFKIELSCDNEKWIPAADISELFLNGEKRELTYDLELNNIPDNCTLALIENGERIKEIMVCEGGSKQHLTFTWQGKEYCWNRLELWNQGGELVMFTNPIYKMNKNRELTTWGEVKKRLEEI